MENEKLSYCRRTIWCALSVEILSTDAQLYKNCIQKRVAEL